MSPNRVDFNFRKSIDLGGHIFLLQFWEKIGKNLKLLYVSLDFSSESENLQGIYCKDPKHYPSIDMSPSGVDFDFRKSIDLGGRVC